LPGKHSSPLAEQPMMAISRQSANNFFLPHLQVRPAPPSSWAIPSSGSGQTGTGYSLRMPMRMALSTTQGS
jgi:hypothetical protein